MNSLKFDVICGASGDMILASLIDAGVPLEHLQAELGRLRIAGLSVGADRVKRSGIMCAHMVLSWDKPQSYRHLPQIMDIVDAGRYPSSVVDNCNRVFTRIAEAEASVHGIPLEQVHFHEIGAVDTIVDVLGTCLCLEFLKVARVVFGPLTTGHGTITCEHGIMPVPAPATAYMLRGFVCQTIDISTEILTPTGCALLTALGEQASSGMIGTVLRAGYGCGDKQFETYPNYIRATLFEEGMPGAAREHTHPHHHEGHKHHDRATPGKHSSPGPIHGHHHHA